MTDPVRFGRYTLLKRLAVGGMAELFLAKQQGPGRFERLLVIKRILPHLAEDPTFTQMFLDEAALAAQLNHPYIAQVYDFGEEQSSYFIAMELVKGPDLRSLIMACKKVNKPPPVDIAMRLVTQALAALDYAHHAVDSNGQPFHLVHRDVSPQNILVSFDGMVKLVDFGVAKAASSIHQTEAGQVKGKYSYLAPEQLSRLQLDGRCDLYAAGLVLYELLTLQKAIEGEGPETIANAMEARIQPINKLRPDLPTGLVEVLSKALRKDRDQRFTDCRSFQNELESLLVSASTPVQPHEVAAFLKTLESEFGQRLSAVEPSGSFSAKVAEAPTLPPGTPAFSDATSLNATNTPATAQPAATSQPVRPVSQAKVQPQPKPQPKIQVAASVSKPADPQVAQETVLNIQNPSVKPASIPNSSVKVSVGAGVSVKAGPSAITVKDPNEFAKARAAMEREFDTQDEEPSGEPEPPRRAPPRQSIRAQETYIGKTPQPASDANGDGDSTSRLKGQVSRFGSGWKIWAVVGTAVVGIGGVALVFNNNDPKPSPKTPMALHDTPDTKSPTSPTAPPAPTAATAATASTAATAPTATTAATAVATAPSGTTAETKTDVQAPSGATGATAPSGTTAPTGTEASTGTKVATADADTSGSKTSDKHDADSKSEHHKDSTSTAASIMEVASLEPRPNKKKKSDTTSTSTSTSSNPESSTKSSSTKSTPTESSTPPIPTAGPATLTVASSPWAEVYFDGKDLGQTPVVKAEVTSGTHKLKLVNGQMGLAKESSITLAVGEAHKENVHFEKGKLSFVVKPWANVTMAGKSLGATPMPDQEVYEGSYQISFANPQLNKTATRTVQVKAGETTSVKVDLTKE
jgi:serine/threonine-protein kinase